MEDKFFFSQDKFFPSKAFCEKANVKDSTIYEKALQNYEAFWKEHAEEIEWIRKPNRTLEWNPPYAKWFSDGILNASVNCLDRHLKQGKKDKIAIYWEGENKEVRELTYEDLYREVNKLANVMKSFGINKGDCVAIYLPMIPEAVISMLACARIGAIHTVVFGGFSSSALRERINNSEAKLLITADGGYRRGKTIPLKAMADQALLEDRFVQKVLVVQRTNSDISLKEGRDFWYHEEMKKTKDFCSPEKVEAEDILFLLYTSGTTGKPKGIIHTTGGYLVQALVTTKYVFDVKDNDIFWCTADVGWITGHTYLAYGPLLNGVTQVMYEGTPDYPDKGRFWNIVEKYKVSIFYTAPTAIRSFMKWGELFPKKYDLSSLRLLGSVGEPINPEAWLWYYKHIGNKNCPIVDTWWQTETGAIMISPLPGITPLKPGSAAKALPGIDIDIFDDEGNPADKGYLVIKKPWPSMLRGIYKDPKRYEKTYWHKWKHIYFSGDGAYRDDEGYIWIMGRVDDVMNISGHRLGTMEVESALVEHQDVAEAAVVGIKDEVKGEAIAAFVSVKEGVRADDCLKEQLKKQVVKAIGPIAKPKKILFTQKLPKTRSGKIMRRLLRDIAEGKVLGDTTTLADSSVVLDLQRKYEKENG